MGRRSAVRMVGRCMQRQGTVLISERMFPETYTHEEHPMVLESLSSYGPNLMLWTGYGHTPILSLKDDNEPRD